MTGTYSRGASLLTHSTISRRWKLLVLVGRGKKGWITLTRHHRRWELNAADFLAMVASHGESHELRVTPTDRHGWLEVMLFENGDPSPLYVHEKEAAALERVVQDMSTA